MRAKTAAKKKRRERDKKARDELADWYVRKLVVASWPHLLDQHGPQLMETKRAMVQLERACREAIKKRGNG